MKTFLIKREFLISQKFVATLLFVPFLLSVPHNVSKTSSSQALVSKNDSRILLSSVKNSQTEEKQNSQENGASIFSRVFAGIGNFFVVIGSGFVTGISETFKFLGTMIALPVTATIALFSRKTETGSQKNESGGGQSRSK